MFEKWDIPDNICSNFPIGFHNLELFVGHDQQIRFLSDMLSNKSVVILEGEIGVGKTSFGNYVRHSLDGFFTPFLEIPCKPRWDNDTFLGIVLAAIVKEILRADSPHKKLQKNKLVRDLNEIFSDVKLANLGISGAGFGVSKGESLSRSGFINQTVLLEYLSELGDLIRRHYDKPAPLIVQLNNLDIDYGFEKEELIRFFNEIRDTLQMPHISWLICGAEGLGNFIRKHVVRVTQIVNSVMTVEPLSLDEVSEAFKKRIKKAGMKGRLPIDDDLLESIYDIANGSFREILNILYQLLVKYYNEPLVKSINRQHARFFFQETCKHRLERLKRSKLQYAVFHAILENPGVTQQTLAKKVKKQQANISRVTRELEADGYIQVKKVSRSNRYYAEPQYQLAL